MIIDKFTLGRRRSDPWEPLGDGDWIRLTLGGGEGNPRRVVISEMADGVLEIRTNCCGFLVAPTSRNVLRIAVPRDLLDRAVSDRHGLRLEPDVEPAEDPASEDACEDEARWGAEL